MVAVRQARADETRARLFAAACRLFAQSGYHETLVSAIAEAAGVAKGTFFVHYPSKDAVITELVGRQVGAARRARAAALATGTPLDALVATVTALGVEAGRSHALTRAVLAANLENQALGGFADSVFTDLLEEMIGDARAAAAQGLLEPRRDAAQLARGLLDAYLGAALHFGTAPAPPPLERLLAPLVDAILAAYVKEVPHGNAGKARSLAAPRAGARPGGRRRVRRR
jgi:AcrR family transcriptional regulator